VWTPWRYHQGQQQGWYCVSCEEFKEERELLEGTSCAIHTNKRSGETSRITFSDYHATKVKRHQEQPDFIQPESRRNEVLSFVRQGLQDFSISANLDWGFGAS